MLLATLQAPAQNLVRLLQAPAQNLTYLLDARRRNLEEGSAPAAPAEASAE
jgi:ribosomal protein L10